MRSQQITAQFIHSLHSLFIQNIWMSSSGLANIMMSGNETVCVCLSAATETVTTRESQLNSFTEKAVARG
jgi:hypothetical protein